MQNIKPISLFLGILIVISLIFVRDIANVSIQGPIIAGFSTLFAIFMNKRNMYSFAYFLLPLSVGIPGYVFLLLGLILLIRQSRTNVSQFFPFFILSSLEVLNVMDYDFQYDISGIVSFLSFLLLFFLMIFSNDENIDRKESLICYSIGVMFSLAVVYFRIIIDNGFAELIAGELRSGAGMGDYDAEQMMNHLMMNANCIAYYAIVLISIAFVFMSKQLIKKSVVCLMILVGVISGLLSFSRTWMVLFTMVMIWYIYSNIRNVKSIVSFIVIGLVILSVGIYSGLLDGILEVFEYRMENDNVESAGGRFPLFEAYNKVITNNLFYTLFGTGATYYKQVCQIWNSVHNGTQQIFVSFGLVGIVTYILVVLDFTKKYITFRVSDNLILFAPFIACFIFVQSIQFLNPYPLMLPFVAAACMIRINEKKYV